MTAHTALTSELKKLVLEVEDDLRERLAAESAIDGQWRDEHRRALRSGRTSGSWEEYRDNLITQVAVSWVLTTVFVRFCEDNGLLSSVWIAGPGPKRQQALDAELAFFQRYPEQTAREWLLQAVRHLEQIPATAGLVDSMTPLWRLRLSGDMAGRILHFWRETDDEGRLRRDFADPELSTRFLGDLYQDLSEHAKKTYALLQTPVFVEEFILDQTLTPALAERPLEGFRLIDPTCGSGHFLLGAFDRFLDQWAEEAPELDVNERVRRALGSVFGVDKNPFAVAIAQFRLTVAALQALGLSSLECAPELELNLVAGDSLLPWHERLDIDDPVGEDHLFSLESEDRAKLARILQPGSYDAVVGNPPYISVSDPSERRNYRSLYASCHGRFVLTVPFMERFFELAKRSNGPAGWVGKITSNSFMKREFGSKLVEQFLNKKDLRLVVDTSGAYIPGHGTPTAILVGCNQAPSGPRVRAVLGIRGEPSQPKDPSRGRVWRELIDHLNDVGFDGRFVTVVDLDRSALRSHPWSLSGGAAKPLLIHVESVCAQKLGALAESIGITAVTGEDDFYMSPPPAQAVRTWPTVPLVEGDLVRDWVVGEPLQAGWPFDTHFAAKEISELGFFGERLRQFKPVLDRRKRFGIPMVERGLAWYEWQELYASKLRTPLSITFAFVATHNHFVLDRGGKVFNRSAPVIKLPAEATEEDHLELLGVLNSSTACFWLKQNCHGKGNGGVNEGFRGDDWEEFYEFTGTTLKDFPLPPDRSLELASRIDQHARTERLALDEAMASPGADGLAGARAAVEAGREHMIALQEELDWTVYGRYGLVDDPPACDDPPRVRLGERAFEIALARRVAEGEEETAWFDRHRSTPITEIPAHWPDDYRALVQRRIDLIESDRFINLLERPEFKRRWASEPWEKTQERLLRTWLLDRLEDRRFWFDRDGRPQPRSVANLADEIARDADLLSVLRLWDGRRDTPPSEALGRLLVPEAVPYLAAYRLKATGLRKFAAWQHTWDLQRREDAGETVDIPVPPKYAAADFRKAEWWQARGKLDVPKERFILYPDANRASDPSALLGWAGWDHLQQALALLSVLTDREQEGAAPELRAPLVAGLFELLPWVRQWHSGPDPVYGDDMAQFVAEQARDQAAAVGLTEAQLADWRPPAPTRGRRRTTPR